ncbi:copper chaperone PCu(A)C [Actinoalloteichus hymeniacidonis]|uniref:Copper chaperone PCu(A)C n=1 Tax=Actinoalloteichus hymeniacidonis TaxID=340345 RepID=A0AAC9HMP3_9PSEU|nr:copper chaperone PCu(A)C [Actinoalloteichus hymeniacidonis]AOS62078.1 hypothetical protein TL08_06265 [Actinoalloteichus hymeniacidonis]MBB5909900.1 hypothetical protein [Actinoalloteichus hymeniacidonis]
MNTRIKNTLRLTVLFAVGSLALAGCATGSTADGAAAEGGAEQASQTEADAIDISDAWVKAADEGMSAAFGELPNSSDQDVTVVSATSEASTMLELHETVENEAGEMTMRQIDGGFVIPANGALTLEPGADHIMLMDLTEPLEAGAEVTFTLTFSDDSTFEFTAPVKDYSGANESYEGDADMDADMDMGH